jgi:hypothetical protein
LQLFKARKSWFEKKKKKLCYAMLYRLPILFLKLRYAFFFIKKKRKGSSKGTLSPSLFLKMTCNLISLVRIPSSSCALN